MKTIHVLKVYERLGHLSPDRNVGWFRTLDDAIEGMHNFGSECRWSYAIIEEIGAGMHGQTFGAVWFQFDDEQNDWVPLEIDPNSSFMNCINHTIG